MQNNDIKVYIFEISVKFCVDWYVGRYILKMLKKNYISSMRPITAHARGHFCMNFKKMIFFEYLIMFRNFLALVLRILEKKGSL